MHEIPLGCIPVANFYGIQWYVPLQSYTMTRAFQAFSLQASHSVLLYLRPSRSPEICKSTMATIRPALEVIRNPHHVGTATRQVNGGV